MIKAQITITSVDDFLPEPVEKFSVILEEVEGGGRLNGEHNHVEFLILSNDKAVYIKGE